MLSSKQRRAARYTCIAKLLFSAFYIAIFHQKLEDLYLGIIPAFILIGMILWRSASGENIIYYLLIIQINRATI